jgi:hypothetical protein
MTDNKNGEAGGVPWFVLTDIERDDMQDKGVEMKQLGMAFTKQPTWEDFCVVFARVYSVKMRYGDFNQNDNANWAIGDCLVAGEDYFGKEKVDKWLREFLHLVKLRDHILSLSGGALVQLQQVEHLIKVCCAMISLKGLKLTLDDVFSLDPSRRSQTLGQMKKALKDNQIFNPAFEEKLTQFVNSRNKFAHSLWTDEITNSRYKKSISGLPTKQELDEVYKFIVKLINESEYIEKVFMGFQFALMPERRKDSNVSSEASPVLRWARYLPEFLKAVEKDAAD